MPLYRLTLSLLLLGSSAQAEGIALLPIEAHQVEAAGQQIDAALHLGLINHPKLKDRGKIKMKLEEARVSFSCFEEREACMAQVGRIFSADRLFWGHLRRSRNIWVLRVLVLDVRRGRLLNDTHLARPAGEGSVEALAQAALRLIMGKAVAAEMKARLIILSDPPQAQVLLNGEPKGPTPVFLDPPIGSHKIELSLFGYQNLKQQLKMGRGHRILELRLKSAEVQVEDLHVPSKPRAENFWFGVGSASLAAVAAGVGVGLGFRVLNLEDEAASLPETEENSAQRASLKSDFERAQLFSNISLGVAALAVGGSLYFFLLAEDPSEGAARLHLNPGGGLFQLSF